MIPSMMRCKGSYSLSLTLSRVLKIYKLPKQKLSFVSFLYLIGFLPHSVFCKSTYEGRTYWDHIELAHFWGMDWVWVQPNKKIQLNSQWTSITYEEHKRTLSLNGYQISLGFPIFKKNGRLYISELDQKNTLFPILANHRITTPPKLYRIVIDAGHGGKDTGAISPYGRIYEKTITLKVTRILQKKLQALGYSVILTRSDDRYLPLEKRTQIANLKQADLFISIHANSTQNTTVQGVETFVFTPLEMPSTGRNLHKSDFFKREGNRNQPWNTLVGFYLQKALVNASSSPDRGLKHARFAVLRDSKMPAALIELGFLSNAIEVKKLNSLSYQTHLADGLLKGIMDYQETLNRIRKK